MSRSNTARNSLLRVFDFISSMPVAIALLSAVAVLSMIGTVLEQNRPADHYMAMLGPFWYKIFAALDFYDMYSSWWFTGMLLFLILSVGLAIIRRGPRIWQTIRRLEEAPACPEPEKLSGKFSLAGGFKQDHIEANLHKLGFRETLSSHLPDGGKLLFTRQGRLAKFGFFLIHGGVLVIALGGLLTSQFGFRGAMSIPEGAAEDIVYVRQGETYREIKLPFKVHNDAFAIDYYNTGMPSNYRTDISLVSGDQKLAAKRILVNEPLQYGGLTFYQASFGDAGSAVTLTLTDLSKPEFPQQIINSNVEHVLQDGQGNKITVSELRQHNIVNMSQDVRKPVLRDVGPSLDMIVQSPANGTITYRVYQAYPSMLAFARVGGKEMVYEDFVFSPADDKLIPLLAAYFKHLKTAPDKASPEAQRTAMEKAMVDRGIPANQIAELGPVISSAALVLQRSQLPMLFGFTAFTAKMYSGIQVSRDPGAPLVWTGSTLLMIGLMMVMYMRERKLWLSLHGGAQPRLEVCAAGGRYDLGLAPLLSELEKALVEGETEEKLPLTEVAFSKETNS